MSTLGISALFPDDGSQDASKSIIVAPTAHVRRAGDCTTTDVMLMLPRTFTGDGDAERVTYGVKHRVYCEGFDSTGSGEGHEGARFVFQNGDHRYYLSTEIVDAIDAKLAAVSA